VSRADKIAWWLLFLIGASLVGVYGPRVNRWLESMAPGEIPEAARSRAVVTMWGGPVGDEQDYVQAAIDAFNRSQRRIWVRYVSTVEDDTKLFRAISAGVPPDLCLLWSQAYVGTLAATGALQPLDERMQRSPIHVKDFIPAGLAMGQYEGKQYALPDLVDISCLFWSERAFNDVGLEVSRGPQTLSELDGYIKKLTKFDANGNLLRLGFEPPDPQVCMAMFGATFYDPEKHRITCDEPRSVEALKWRKHIQELQGGPEKVAAFQAGFGNFDSPQHHFFHGLVAMEAYGEWWPGYVKRYGPHVRYRIGRLPYPDQYPQLKDLTFFGCGALGIPTGSKHPEEAWEFMEWMQTKKGQEIFAAGMQGCPNIISVAWEMVPTLEEIKLADSITVDPRLSFEEQKRLHEPVRTARYGVACEIALSPKWIILPVLPVNTIYLRELLTAYQYAERGSKTPERALADCQKRVQEALNEYLE